MLAHVDLEQPRIASIVRTYTAVLPFPIKGGKLYLYNNNPLLIYGYPGLTGLKTGYTWPPGRCLVATAERHGVRLGVVAAQLAQPRRSQASELLDRGFEDDLPPGARARAADSARRLSPPPAAAAIERRFLYTD